MEANIVVSPRKNNTDAVCASIAFAYLERKLYQNDSQPISPNTPNEQTEFLLKKFQLEAPKCQGDIFPKANNIKQEQVIWVGEQDSIARALELYSLYNYSVMPCLNSDKKCVGLLSFSDLFSVFMSQRDEQSVKSITTCIATLIQTIKGHQIKGPTYQQLDFKAVNNYNIMTLCGCSDNLIKQLSSYTDQEFAQTIFISSYNPQINNYVIGRNAAVLILCPINPKNQLQLQDDDEALYYPTVEMELIDHGLKDSKNTVVIKTNLSPAVTTLLSKQSTPVGLYANRNPAFIVNQQIPLDQIRIKMNMFPEMAAAAVVDNEGLLTGIITKKDLLNEHILNVSLVGCSSLDKAPKGIDAQGVFLQKIIDVNTMHSNQTQLPIDITVRNYASTCTLVSQIFKEKNQVPPVKIAGILLGGILAQTKMLKSPHTTQMDVLQVNYLSMICGVDPVQLAKQMFQADDTTKLVEKIKLDQKFYQLSIGPIYLSQIEVGDIDDLEHESLIELEKGLKSDLKTSWFSGCMITDVIKSISVFVFVCDSQYYSQIEEHFGFLHQFETINYYYMPDMISRKKQLLPHITQILNKIIVE
ncbi:Inorganic_diphosphatase [Hexamita inflata]|uniref:Inorganic diphosphatase n=1 Tax=Hexamita inflata TaxID=28002 RepID=A0AA86NBB2_9EUKA|nr:Inorganic diphosphatase [Hexamita inflata]